MKKLQYYIKLFFQEDREPLEALHSRIFIKWLLHYSYLPDCGFNAELTATKDGITVRRKEFSEEYKRIVLIDLIDNPIEFVESELLPIPKM